MKSAMNFRLFLGAAAILVALAILPSSVMAESCRPVSNPYEGTRYEGIDIAHIEAEGVGCSKARRVARRAHKKGWGLTPDVNGNLRYQWNGWDVDGNLRPTNDRYRAERRGNLVRWRF